ncbi:terpene synthase-like [Bicyclus anynana]|uniref:Terpene synthase-like n=1 Tax=Bicyclus anynana TaxID=110368 RepID=A0A6J1MK15_BICAN|nr:terpene synthase-like [Bicyclus anynana]
MALNIVDEKLHLEKTILAPYTYLLQIKGKQLRLKISRAFNHWLKLSDDKLNEVLDTARALHTATLLFDDIQDDAKLRRGLPAAHRVYGANLTFNTSMHVLFLVLNRFMEIHPKAAKIYAEDFLEALRGQSWELYWRDNVVCPTEEEYKTMLRKKTGRMFTLPVRVCQLFSNFKTDVTDLAELLGYYFQLRDDYCNLSQQDALEEWPGEEDIQADRVSSYCEDITEGRFNLPVIHAINTPVGPEVLNIIRQRTEDISLKKYCLSLLEKAGSLQYTRNLLAELDRSARAEIARLGGNPPLEAALDEMLSWKD